MALHRLSFIFNLGQLTSPLNPVPSSPPLPREKIMASPPLSALPQRKKRASIRRPGPRVFTPTATVHTITQHPAIGAAARLSTQYACIPPALEEMYQRLRPSKSTPEFGKVINHPFHLPLQRPLSRLLEDFDLQNLIANSLAIIRTDAPFEDATANADAIATLQEPENMLALVKTKLESAIILLEDWDFDDEDQNVDPGNGEEVVDFQLGHGHKMGLLKLRESKDLVERLLASLE